MSIISLRLPWRKEAGMCTYVSYLALDLIFVVRYSPALMTKETSKGRKTRNGEYKSNRAFRPGNKVTLVSCLF